MDVCLSVFNFFHCFLASIILTLYISYGRYTADEYIAADVFGFLLAILYAVEIYFLKSDAPGNLGKRTKSTDLTLFITESLPSCYNDKIIPIPVLSSRLYPCMPRWIFSIFLLLYHASVFLHNAVVKAGS